jgi:hypothetical protein
VVPPTPVTTVQVPAAHWPLSHTVPQVPQLFGSIDVSTHAPSQLTSGAEHVQEPFTHVCPAAQALPHEPQFMTFALTSTHAPLQLVSLAAH